jgi:hypothetical protein
LLWYDDLDDEFILSSVFLLVLLLLFTMSFLFLLFSFLFCYPNLYSLAQILKDPTAAIVQEALQYVTQQLTIPLSKFHTRLEAIPSSEIFQCMALFGQAFGEKFEPHIKTIIGTQGN